MAVISISQIPNISSAAELARIESLIQSVGYLLAASQDKAAILVRMFCAMEEVSFAARGRKDAAQHEENLNEWRTFLSKHRAQSATR